MIRNLENIGDTELLTKLKDAQYSLAKIGKEIKRRKLKSAMTVETFLEEMNSEFSGKVYIVGKDILFKVDKIYLNSRRLLVIQYTKISRTFLDAIANDYSTTVVYSATLVAFRGAKIGKLNAKFCGEELKKEKLFENSRQTKLTPAIFKKIGMTLDKQFKTIKKTVTANNKFFASQMEKKFSEITTSINSKF